MGGKFIFSSVVEVGYYMGEIVLVCIYVFEILLIKFVSLFSVLIC